MSEGRRESPDNRHQILALSGGGFRGLFQIAFLEHCEARYGLGREGLWPDRFELIAGTSVGALLAAGLASGKSAKMLRNAMRTHGELIFERRLGHNVRRFVRRAPYATESLRKAVNQILGDDMARLPLNRLAVPLLITAVDYTSGNVKLFRSAGLAGTDACETPLIEAVLASAAAPTYFPMVAISKREYADGGLVANAPDLAALVEAMTLQKARLDACYMLSVGTAGWRDREALRDTPRRPGILSWLAMRGLVQTIMAAQESLATSHAKKLLGDRRYLRIDRTPDRAQAKRIKSLDNASEKAADGLEQLAQDAWTAHCDDPRLRDFLSR